MPTEAQKIANKKYRKTEKGKEMRKREGIKYRKNHPQYQITYDLKHKKEIKERNKIQHLYMKKLIYDLRSNGCSICGYNKNQNSLHFHHVEPENKKFNINVRNTRTESLFDELNKCILLCANCHGEIHSLLNQG